MNYQANIRIKRNGKYIAPGEPLSLSDEEFAELPAGAASKVANDAAEEEVSTPTPTPTPTPQPDPVVTAPEGTANDEQNVKLAAAVGALLPADFKQDGEIRAAALRELVESLGFVVSVEDVAALRAPVKE